MVFIKIYLLILALFTVGCTGGERADLPQAVKDLENVTIYRADESPENEIQLVRDEAFQNTEVLIGEITDFVVDEEGRIYIADGQQYVIHVFEPDGDYLTSIGRRGSGPGEFQDFYFLTDYENQIYVHDYSQRRISVFDQDSAVLSHTINLNPENWQQIDELVNSFPTSFAVRDDDEILMRFVQIPNPDQYGESVFNRYFVLNDEGEITSDLILRQRGIEYLVSNSGGTLNLLRPPFVRSSLMAFSPDGTIYEAWSEDFLIKAYDRNGNYLSAFYYPHVKAALNRGEFLDLFSEEPLLRQSYAGVELPDTWPVLNQMFVDDNNRLWVSTITDDEEDFTWWVLEGGGGRVLAKFEWPGRRLERDLGDLQKIIVKNGFLYTIETDKETGLETMVRYSMEVRER